MYFLFLIEFSNAAGSESEAELFHLLNTFRKEKGMQNVERNKNLDKAAKIQADYCAKINRFTSTQDQSLTQKFPSDRIRMCQYLPEVNGEVKAAFASNDAKLPFDRWIKNTNANSIILGSYSDIGIASAKSSKGKIYWICDYATSKEKKSNDDNDEKSIEDYNDKTRKKGISNHEINGVLQGESLDNEKNSDRSKTEKEELVKSDSKKNEIDEPNVEKNKELNNNELDKSNNFETTKKLNDDDDNEPNKKKYGDDFYKDNAFNWME